jgi:hypothetical protein
MNHRHDHTHRWQFAPPDEHSLVDSYICAVCHARKSAAMFVFPGSLECNVILQEVALWIEYVQAVIVHQEKTIVKFRQQLPTAKTPAISRTLKYLERALMLNNLTLRQFAVGAQMLVGLRMRPPRLRLPRTRRVSTTNC